MPQVAEVTFWAQGEYASTPVEGGPDHGQVMWARVEKTQIVFDADTWVGSTSSPPPGVPPEKDEDVIYPLNSIDAEFTGTIITAQHAAPHYRNSSKPLHLPQGAPAAPGEVAFRSTLGTNAVEWSFLMEGWNIYFQKVSAHSSLVDGLHPNLTPSPFRLGYPYFDNSPIPYPTGVDTPDREAGQLQLLADIEKILRPGETWSEMIPINPITLDTISEGNSNTPMAGSPAYPTVVPGGNNPSIIATPGQPVKGPPMGSANSTHTSRRIWTPGQPAFLPDPLHGASYPATYPATQPAFLPRPYLHGYSPSAPPYPGFVNQYAPPSAADMSFFDFEGSVVKDKTSGQTFLIPPGAPPVTKETLGEEIDGMSSGALVLGIAALAGLYLLSR